MEPRHVALVIIEHNGKFLLAESRDDVKNEIFYRPLGGGIDSGETGEEAVVREVEEEIGYKIANVKYLGEIENIYTFNGRAGHEVDKIYTADFVDDFPYTQNTLPKIDGHSKIAKWMSQQDLKDKIIYPTGIQDFIFK